MELVFNQSPLGTYDVGHRNKITNTKVSYIKMFFAVLSLFAGATFLIGKLNIISCLCSACYSACKSACGSGNSSSSSSNGCTKIDYEYAYVVDDKGGKIEFVRSTSKKACSKKSYGSWSIYKTTNSGYREFVNNVPKGYELVGYYKDAGLTKQISMSDFERGKTYYAKYRELYVGESRTITFETNLPKTNEYKNIKVDSITVVYGSQVTDFPVIPDVEGYTFKGIYVSNDSRSTQIFNSSLEINLEYKEAHYYNWDISKLYVLYEPQKVYVNLIFKNGTETLASNNIVFDYNDVFALANVNTYSILGGDRHKDIIAITVDGVPIDLDTADDFTVTVKYDFDVVYEVGEVRYVGFKFNTSTLVDREEAYPYGSDVLLPLMNQYKDAKPGYTPKGWSYSNTSYTTAEIITTIDQIESDKVVFLIWEPQIYEIEYRSSFDNTLQGTGKCYGAQNQTQVFTILDGTNLVDLDIQNFLSTRERVRGYEVKGLSLTKNPTSQTDYITAVPKNVTEKLVVYVVYQPITITIKVFPGQGDLSNANKTQYVKYDENINLIIPTYTTHPEYVFAGYVFNDKSNVERMLTDAEGRYVSAAYKSIKDWVDAGLLDFDTVSSSNGLVVAAKQADKYLTITYYNGSTKLNNVDEQYTKVKYGTSITYTLTPPNGFDFAGWSITQGSTAVYSSTVTSDLTLYAVFSPKNVTTTLSKNAQGGVLEDVELFTSNKVIHIQYGANSGTIDLPATLNQNKYNFVGYFYHNNNTGTDIQITNGQGQISNLITFNEEQFGMSYSDFISSGVTLFGKVEIKKFSVTYMVGQSSTVVNDVQYGTVAENKAIQAKDGYTARGWATEAYSNTNTYEQVAYDFSQGVKANTTIYAYYEPKTYQVTLLFTEGTISGANPVTVKYGEDYTFAVPTYTDVTKAFGGYKLNDTLVANAQGVMLFENLPILSYASLEGGITLTEVVALKTFNIKYMVGTTEIGVVSVTYNQLANKPVDPDPAQAGKGTGYSFKGWSTQTQGNKKYYEMTMFDFDNTQVTQDYVLYAVFDNWYKITFYDADKTTVLTSKYVQYGTNWSSVDNGKTKYGSAFTGWFDKAGSDSIPIIDAEKYIYSHNPYDLLQDLELYAKTN